MTETGTLDNTLKERLGVVHANIRAKLLISMVELQSQAGAKQQMRDLTVLALVVDRFSKDPELPLATAMEKEIDLLGESTGIRADSFFGGLGAGVIFFMATAKLGESKLSDVLQGLVPEGLKHVRRRMAEEVTELAKFP